MAIASLIIGLAMFVSFGTGNIYSAPFNLVGVILGIIAMKKTARRRIAVVGIVLNAIGILYIAAIIVTWGILGD